MKIAKDTARVEHPEKLYNGEGTLHLAEFMGKSELKGAGRRVGIMTIPSRCSIGIHTHTGECEAYYVLKGEGRYHDNGEEYMILPGDFTLCKDGDSHGIWNDGDEELQLFIVILNSVSEK